MPNPIEIDDTASPLEGVEETAYERDYSKVDLVDLIDQPAWKTILIGLVNSEQMDPWNIDVTELAEKYLKKINELEYNSLRVPANAILACAILVKTKSKYLKLSSLDEDEKEQVMTEEQKQLFLEELPDLMANRSFREGRISLDELVESIEDIIHRTNPKKSAARVVPKMELNFDTTSIEEKMGEVFESIKQKVDSQGVVLFNDLCADSGIDSVVETFLPVLFLMNNGKIVAYQQEFFGDIFVQLLAETANAEKIKAISS
jgi:segregation and condensation protein A